MEKNLTFFLTYLLFVLLTPYKLLKHSSNLKEVIMAGSVYVVNEIVGTSTKSWEDAAKQAVETAAKSVEDIRIGEVVKQDLTVENGKVISYRVRLNISFKFHTGK
jgi:flavin-binding protein dodecin